MARAKFEAELIEGHKGVTAVLVPFDPEAVWGDPPVRLAGRRHGWPVTGTVNGARFRGYVGERWGRFFVTIDSDLRAAARARVGDTLAVAVAPARTRAAVAIATEQSRVTTQPRTASPRAVAFPPAGRRRASAPSPRARSPVGLLLPARRTAARPPPRHRIRPRAKRLPNSTGT